MRSIRWVLMIVLALLPPAAVAGADPLVVRTDPGVVRGIKTATGREWRGVPFAAAPTGELRWRPPAPAVPWSGIRDADEFGPICPQLAWDAERQVEYVDGLEDCLFLNIFVPAGPADALPVMVNLHGGSNWGFWPHRSASALTEKGVIVVTTAYRLGTFGFVGHPALTEEGGGSSGEYGLLDQIAALEWVRDNIAAFGGDPGNVTLFGESAGSFDAMAIVLSDQAEGLFQRAALQTVAVAALEGWESIATAERFGRDMASGVGCTDASEVLACLRAAPAADLVKAVGFNDVTPYVGGMILPKTPVDLLADRPELIPLLVGSNREERANWLVPPPGDPPFTMADYEETTRSVDATALTGEAVRLLYPVEAFESPLWAAVAVWTDAIYTCPVRAVALASPGPVWRYLFTQQLAADPALARLRAAHFLDEPLLFGDPGLLDGFGVDYRFDASDLAVSDTLATYWTNFAKTGDPNGSGMLEWPAFERGSESILVLDDPVTTLDRWRADECDALRETTRN